MLGNILPPYHSLQELNLDWILTKVKNILRFVPDDGAVGQILRRTAHGAEWSNEQSPTVPVQSVNGQTGDVVLDASDVGALPDSTLYAASNSSGGPAVMSNALHWGAVDPTSTATNFTAQITGITSYYEGLTIVLRNGVVASTTNCTLNVNGLGALPIYPSTSNTRVSTAWSAAYTMIFVYTENKISGTPLWEMQYGMAYSNSIGYQLRTNNARLPMSDVMYRYRLMFTSADGTKFVPANTSSSTNATAARTTNSRPIDPFGAIFYYGTTSSVSAGSKPSASNIWQQYVVTLGYSFNNTGSALTLTTDQPVYLRCAPQADGSAVMEYFTQSLPTTEDGKIYIFLGLAASTTTIELIMCHPVYYYKSGAIRIWTNAAAGGGGAVDSVNGQTGTVVLTASDVGALPDTSDHIIETGTSGSWSYRKWSGGMMEAWYVDDVLFPAPQQGPYNGFYRHVTTITMLSGFTSILMTLAQGQNSCMFIAQGVSTTSDCTLYLLHAVSNTANITVAGLSVYVVGKWN